MSTRWISLVALLAFALASCSPSTSNGQDENLEPSVPLAPPSQELELKPEDEEMLSNPPPIEKFINLARKDLVDRIQIDETKIALSKTEELIWPNAALGCPAPGKVYAQGKVPGYRIWLDAGGVEYIYHTDWFGQVVLCPTILDPEDIPSLPENIGPTPQIGVPIK